MAEPSPETRKRILLIDDVAELRELAQAVLEEEGYVVDVAPDASLGGLKLLANKPDLVILDLMMPGVDGFQFLEYVRETLEKPPPVVFLSGSRTTKTALKGLGLGAFAFLAKPVNFATLVETCRAALRRSEPGATGVERERRQQVRRAVLVQVQLLVANGARGAALGELIEISAGGAAIVSLATLPVGERVQVTPDPRVVHVPQPLTAEIKSRSQVETGFRYGVAFVDLTPEMERLLREALAPA